MNSKSIALAIATFALCASTVVAQTTSMTTATGPNGNTAIRNTSRYPGGRSSTLTGPNGQSSNRTVTGRGTGDETVSRTGPHGTSSRHR